MPRLPYSKKIISENSIIKRTSRRQFICSETKVLRHKSEYWARFVALKQEHWQWSGWSSWQMERASAWIYNLNPCSYQLKRTILTGKSCLLTNYKCKSLRFYSYSLKNYKTHNSVSDCKSGVSPEESKPPVFIFTKVNNKRCLDSSQAHYGFQREYFLLSMC